MCNRCARIGLDGFAPSSDTSYQLCKISHLILIPRLPNSLIVKHFWVFKASFLLSLDSTKETIRVNIFWRIPTPSRASWLSSQCHRVPFFCTIPNEAVPIRLIYYYTQSRSWLDVPISGAPAPLLLWHCNLSWAHLSSIFSTSLLQYVQSNGILNVDLYKATYETHVLFPNFVRNFHIYLIGNQALQNTHD